jgi:hypothetical protein
MPWWLAAVASAHVPVIYVVGPTEDWCATINGTIGNDLVMLLPGEYRGPCVITADLSDVPVEETLLVSFDPADPAVFTGSDADFVLSIDGQRLVVWQLVFRGLGPGVDAVRVGPMVRTWIRASTFDSVETAVRQVGDVGELLVTQNHFVDVGTGVVIGCAGGACSAPAFEVHDNWFERTALAFDVATGSTGTRASRSTPPATCGWWTAPTTCSSTSRPADDSLPGGGGPAGRAQVSEPPPKYRPTSSQVHWLRMDSRSPNSRQAFASSRSGFVCRE